MRLLIINGPNINKLGYREPDIYGIQTYDTMIAKLTAYARKHGIQLDSFQSNHEGELIDCIHNAMGKYDGIIINPAAYTHYSYAIRDAIQAINLPIIEVHISNIYRRELFRHQSVTAPVCTGQITGLGIQGYFLAIDYFLHTLANNNKTEECL
ncbi:MAG: type II 3-dehydroquinate dehydratase [Caldicoprobacterales bacterium]|jgi:3-dehydroquinate dehydratase-2